MYSKYFLLLAIAIHASSGFECPNYLQGEYADVEDCASYYRCQNGIAYGHECPEGLYFNQEELTCDWPQNVDCGHHHGAIPGTKRDLGLYLPGIAFCFGRLDGEYRYPEDCGKFYHCSNELTYLKDCPSILHFSEITRRCEWPHEANCTGGSIPIPSTTAIPTTSTTTVPTRPVTSPFETTQSSENFTCEDKECGRYPDPGDCSAYYICGENKTHVGHKQCPDGLLFNPIILDCDLPENVNCNGTSSTTPGFTEPDTTATSTSAASTGTTPDESNPSTPGESTTTPTPSNTTTAQPTTPGDAG
ncbi:unnamed protein product, partial [Allacma fusca]